ncbi:unnamed protein product [Onchocerca flexuosa]|uniref:Osteopetrosis-associated transmembrane protein 1 n=1 Tax=Onchocerca flexuosa TaxID=387005 RepID=A0A183H8Q7_9BILA|nr:unnamed protein product [Onchocerca flexuosa]
MKQMNDVAAFCIVIWFCSYIAVNNGLIRISSNPYDLNAPCQPYIEMKYQMISQTPKFAEASSKMIRCATLYSSPPKVCTYCTEEYIALKQVEYKLLKLENVFSHDNTTCNRVIYENYLISYVSEVSTTITRNIWENSRCPSCVKINWKFETNSTEYIFYNDTINFQNKLRCVSNFSSSQTNQSVICDKCLSSFDELFQFYWHIYTTPNINFCLDVETTMNDTMNLWHNVWHCSDDRVEELRDWTLLGYSLALLMIITVFFYADSQLEAPSGLRSYLLNSSLDRISSTLTTGSTEQTTTLH